MTFTITYRSQSGALQKEVVEAANRAEALEQAKARGIKPVSVKEGGALNAVKKAAKPAWIKGAVAGLVVVVVTIVALVCLMPAEKPAAPKAEKPKKAKVEKPVPKPRTAVKPLETNVSAKVSTGTKPKKYEGRLEPGDPGWDPREHPFVLVYTNKPPENPEGGIAHRNATEQVLDWIFSCKIGDPPGLCPALPGNELANIAQILEQGAVYEEGDSEDTLEHKAIIAAAKRELQDYITKGGTPQRFIEYYHGQLMSYHQQYQDAQKMVLQAARETPELAAELVKKVNANLAEKGIKPVVLSKKMRERFGIEQE